MTSFLVILSKFFVSAGRTDTWARLVMSSLLAMILCSPCDAIVIVQFTTLANLPQILSALVQCHSLHKVDY